jgi:Tfp pilus assembly protein PilO
VNRYGAPVLGLAIAVLIAVAFFFLLWQPLGDDIQEVRDETAALETRRSSLENEVAQLREIEANQVQIRAALARLEEYIPSGTAQSTAVRQFQLAADAAGVEIISVTFSPPAVVADAPPTGTPDTVLASIPVNMVLEGGYFQVVDFFRRVEIDTTRAVLLANVALEEAEDNFPALQSSWFGELFSIVPAPAGPATAPAPPPAEGEPTDEETPADGDATDGEQP